MASDAFQIVCSESEIRGQQSPSSMRITRRRGIEWCGAIGWRNLFCALWKMYSFDFPLGRLERIHVIDLPSRWRRATSFFFVFYILISRALSQVFTRVAVSQLLLCDGSKELHSGELVVQLLRRWLHLKWIRSGWRHSESLNFWAVREPGVLHRFCFFFNWGRYRVVAGNIFWESAHGLRKEEEKSLGH